MFAYEWIRDAISASTSTETRTSKSDMLTAQLSYAELIHHIMRAHHSAQWRPLSDNPGLAAGDAMKLSRQRLDQWRSRLMYPLTVTGETNWIEFQGHHVSRSAARGDIFCLFCQYHRAVFLIYRPWIDNTTPTGSDPGLERKASGGEGVQKWRQHCMEQCVESACAVIKSTNIIVEQGMPVDR